MSSPTLYDVHEVSTGVFATRTLRAEGVGAAEVAITVAGITGQPLERVVPMLIAGRTRIPANSLLDGTAAADVALARVEVGARKRVLRDRLYQRRGGARQRAAEAHHLALAYAVIANGHPYVTAHVRDGDGESGPYSVLETGYRWGQVKVLMNATGDVALVRDRDVEGFAASWHWLKFSSGGDRSTWYAGQGAMIRDHLQAVRENAARNGMAFVRTGARPTDPTDPFHLDNIVARESAARAA